MRARRRRLTECTKEEVGRIWFGTPESEKQKRGPKPQPLKPAPRNEAEITAEIYRRLHEKGIVLNLEVEFKCTEKKYLPRIKSRVIADAVLTKDAKHLLIEVKKDLPSARASEGQRKRYLWTGLPVIYVVGEAKIEPAVEILAGIARGLVPFPEPGIIEV